MNENTGQEYISLVVETELCTVYLFGARENSLRLIRRVHGKDV